MSEYTYGFIGAGNMGGALALAASKAVGGEKVYLADHDTAKAQALADRIGASVLTTAEIAETCDYIFLGVKPQMMRGMLSGIFSALESRKGKYTLISMAAGMTIETLKSLLPAPSPLIRIMPNTPVSVGEGMILYDISDDVSDGALEGFLAAMANAGKLDRLEERLIDAGCAVSGCGPAFVDLFIEALADGGTLCGLPRAKALLYAEQMILGTAKLAVESGKHPGQLKDDVCSPGGSTIVGVKALEDGGFRSAALNAVVAAYEKTQALGK